MKEIVWKRWYCCRSLRTAKNCRKCDRDRDDQNINEQLRSFLHQKMAYYIKESEKGINEWAISDRFRAEKIQNFIDYLISVN